MVLVLENWGRIVCATHERRKSLNVVIPWLHRAQDFSVQMIPQMMYAWCMIQIMHEMSPLGGEIAGWGQSNEEINDQTTQTLRGLGCSFEMGLVCLEFKIGDKPNECLRRKAYIFCVLCSTIMPRTMACSCLSSVFVHIAHTEFQFQIPIFHRGFPEREL